MAFRNHSIISGCSQVSGNEAAEDSVCSLFWISPHKFTSGIVINIIIIHNNNNKWQPKPIRSQNIFILNPAATALSCGMIVPLLWCCGMKHSGFRIVWRWCRNTMCPLCSIRISKIRLNPFPLFSFQSEFCFRAFLPKHPQFKFIVCHATPVSYILYMAATAGRLLLWFCNLFFRLRSGDRRVIPPIYSFAFVHILSGGMRIQPSHSTSAVPYSGYPIKGSHMSIVVGAWFLGPVQQFSHCWSFDLWPINSGEIQSNVSCTVDSSNAQYIYDRWRIASRSTCGR